MKRTVERFWPFESKYLRDFVVLEELQPGRRLFPRTDQLPLLSKAINREFMAGLTTRLAATDGRADPWRKLQLHTAAFAFSTFLNAARPDHLHVRPYYTPELVTQMAVVQHITEIEPDGNRYWFRYFRDDAFLPDIYLSGKRVLFSGHAIDRFGQRAVNVDCPAISTMHDEFLNAGVAALRLNGGQPALAFGTGGSLAVMPFTETDEEFFILTTLSPNEISKLEPLEPPRPLDLHYGPDYRPPATRTYWLDRTIGEFLEMWRTKKPLHDQREMQKNLESMSWTRLTQLAKRNVAKENICGETWIDFRDGVYGPVILTYRTKRPPPAPAPADLSTNTP